MGVMWERETGQERRPEKKDFSFGVVAISPRADDIFWKKDEGKQTKFTIQSINFIAKRR